MEFFSIEPLELDVTSFAASPTNRSHVLTGRVRNLLSSDYTKSQTSDSSLISSLPINFVRLRPMTCTLCPNTFIQINAASELQRIVNRTNSKKRKPFSKWRSMKALDILLTASASKFLLAHSPRLLRFCASIIYTMCNLPFPSFALHKTKLKDISAASKQLLTCPDRIDNFTNHTSTTGRC
jgi:hypothetical protein